MKRERVQKVLEGKIPDRVPKGEFEVEEGLAVKICGIKGFKGQVKAAEHLGLDFIAPTIMYKLKETKDVDFRGNKIFVDALNRKVSFKGDSPFYCGPSCNSLDEVLKMDFPLVTEEYWTNVNRWKRESDLFVFALVDGIFQTLSSLLNFTELLMCTIKEQEKLKEAIAKILEYIKNVINCALKAGADGIILGEDIAFDGGTFVSPKILEEIFFPSLKDLILEVPSPVIYHSDGNINSVFDSLVSLGITGVHSLQSSSGMDLEEIKKIYGEKIVLVGNLDLDDLQNTPLENIDQIIKDILAHGASDGRFMFSSSAGILDKNLPVENILAAYKAVEVFGKY